MSEGEGQEKRNGVRIWRCIECGTAYFPERLLCPRCGGHDFAEDRVTEGVIEEITVIRHVLGQTDWQPHRLANVTHGERSSHDGGLARRVGTGNQDRVVRRGHGPVRQG